MVPTKLAVRPAQTHDTLVRSSGLDCVIESLCGFWKVGRVHERLPTKMLEFLKRHAAVVQHALIDMGRLAVGPVRPDEAWYCFGDLAEFVFAFPQRFLGALALRHVCRSADEFDELSVPIKNRVPR